MNLNSRYGLIEMTYDTRLHVETVGHGILAFQMLLYLDHVMKLQSVPLSDEFKLALQDAHYPRKHDFVFDEGYRDLSSALAAFEAPLVNLATTIKKDRHAQEIKDKKLNAYVARQLAKYS